MGLRCGEPHLDLLALTSRLLEGFSLRKRTDNVSGVFVDVAWGIGFGQLQTFQGNLVVIRRKRVLCRRTRQ